MGIAAGDRDRGGNRNRRQLCSGCHQAGARFDPRSATKQYQPARLKGFWQHPPYFHNGTAPTLAAVVATYNTRKSLGLTASEISDVEQYLKSL
jgi:cytochrome c peroxidase